MIKQDLMTLFVVQYDMILQMDDITGKTTRITLIEILNLQNVDLIKRKYKSIDIQVHFFKHKMLISRIYIRSLQSKRYDNYIFTMGLTAITQTYLFAMNLTAIRQNWLVTILPCPTPLDYISNIASVL